MLVGHHVTAERSMPDNTIVKQVFMPLYNLHNQGFGTWFSKAKVIAE